MKMNGCALVVLGGPDLSDTFSEIYDWVARSLGEGGSSRVYGLPSRQTSARRVSAITEAENAVFAVPELVKRLMRP